MVLVLKASFNKQHSVHASFFGLD